MFTFGKVSGYQGKDKFEIDISDDKRAFTLSFSDLQAAVDGGNGGAPLATHDFSLVIPLQDDGKASKDKVEIEFAVNGGMVTTEKATASAMLSVNGQTTVVDRAASSEDSLVGRLKFEEKSPTECRLCVFLQAGRDSANGDAAAFVNVQTIDGEILPRPK